MMKFNRTPLYAIAALLIAALACEGIGTLSGPEITATFESSITQAFGTVIAANTTATAVALEPGVTIVTPTATGNALPSETPTTAPSETPGASGCNDNAKFVKDVTIPDLTEFAAPNTFTKTWRIQNTGTCAWDTTYTLRFESGDQLSGPEAVPFPGRVAPGAEMDISVNLIAPAKPGAYTGRWRLTNPAGQGFGTNGTPITVIIYVPEPPTATFTNTPTATITNTPTATITNTPTATATGSSPIVLFTAGFAGSWTCDTQPRVSFQIVNTGSAPIESLNLRVEGPIGTVLQSGVTQNAPFRSSPTQATGTCATTGSETLAPGAAMWVNTSISVMPAAGTTGRGVIKLCTQNDLGGSCLQVTVDFTY